MVLNEIARLRACLARKFPLCSWWSPGFWGRIITAAEQQIADDKARAEIAKLVAETSKINNENRFYPLVVGSGATLAIVAIVKLFL